MQSSEEVHNLPERIEDNTVVLYDETKFGSKTLKEVEIHTVDGKIHTYKIIRTSKGKYLFN